MLEFRKMVENFGFLDSVLKVGFSVFITSNDCFFIIIIQSRFPLFESFSAEYYEKKIDSTLEFTFRSEMGCRKTRENF